MACLAQATAVRYNAASAAEVRQRMIDAQSIDRNYATDSVVRRPDGYAKRSGLIPLTKATSIHSDQYIQHCPKKSGRVCNDQGVCLGGPDEAKRCACFDTWFGVACHLKHCPNHIQKTSEHTKNQLEMRVVFHAGTGTDGGQASPSDFLECSGRGWNLRMQPPFLRRRLFGAFMSSQRRQRVQRA